MELKSIGVIGAGTMGIGLATDLVFHDFSVVLIDISMESIEKAKKEIYR